MTDRWRYVCPHCGNVSLYVGTTSYRCKQCHETFRQRYNKEHNTLM